MKTSYLLAFSKRLYNPVQTALALLIWTSRMLGKFCMFAKDFSFKHGKTNITPAKAQVEHHPRLIRKPRIRRGLFPNPLGFPCQREAEQTSSCGAPQHNLLAFLSQGRAALNASPSPAAPQKAKIQGRETTRTSTPNAGEQRSAFPTTTSYPASPKSQSSNPEPPSPSSRQESIEL